MKALKTNLFAIGISVLMCAPIQAAQTVTYADKKLDNGIISVAFNHEQGTFSIHDASSQEVLLRDAAFKLPLGEKPSSVKVLSVKDVDDRIGKGKRVVLKVLDWNFIRYAPYNHKPPLHLFSSTLYENNPALVLGFGLKTPNYISLRLMKAQPLAGGIFWGGHKIKEPLTLNGGAGADLTSVEPGLSRISPNSLMLTGIVNNERRTAVWGGLGYKEFATVTTLKDGFPNLITEDPVGRLIDEDQTYLAEDTFYLDVYTREPFEALERYGRAMRVANNARPNVYDFPVTCGWSISHVSRLPDVNTSSKLLKELELANACGITRYTDVSLRLEPDKYHDDTEQGWWDDAHMRKYGHLTKPYDTIAKWSAEMRANNGVPYIYMQLGMPSDDFVRKFPQYMLFNDASEIDRRTPGYNKRKNKHPHHQPYVSYDYTDKEFSDHFVKVWRKLREDGIQGVKVDYAATGWRPEGGFDDRYSTCNAAYRRAFALLREAFGEDGLIDERNLGKSGRPCLDVTAGLVDTQRTWSDSNKYVPGMISKSGLRWYKNRTVFNYYSDTKTVHKSSKDLLESMLTMNFLTSGRLDLSSSYSLFTPEITRAVSRTYPHYKEAKTARPLDAFTGIKDPQVYDLELTADWHQVALYNTGEEASVVSTSISGERVGNALGLDPKESYHAYDFWADAYLGKLPGTGSIQRKLKPNCCAMVSVRTALPRPQVISTDRHILQGWVDLKNVKWNVPGKTLSGTARVVGEDPFKIVVANNGHKIRKANAKGCRVELAPHPVAGLSTLTLSAKSSSDVDWVITYE